MDANLNTSGDDFRRANEEVIKALLNELSVYRALAMELVEFVDSAPEEVIENLSASIRDLRVVLFVTLSFNNYPQEVITKIRDELRTTNSLLVKMSRRERP